MAELTDKSVILGLHIPTLISMVDAFFKLCIKDLHIALQSATYFHSKNDKDYIGVNKDYRKGTTVHVEILACRKFGDFVQTCLK